jgi:hypothetical protein
MLKEITRGSFGGYGTLQIVRILLLYSAFGRNGVAGALAYERAPMPVNLAYNQDHEHCSHYQDILELLIVSYVCTLG